MNKLFPESPDINRRKFMINTVKSAGALSLLSIQNSFGMSNDLAARQYTVNEVIELILREGGLSPIANTVDTIKFGKGETLVSGIVTTMFPTIAVIEEAAKLKANFIIAHEPSFYNHRDDETWVEDNTTLKEKQALLERYKMVLWRFHDYCHALKPDAVSYGVAKRANWLSYYKPGEIVLTIPRQSLGQLVQHLKLSLGISHLRIIGNLQQSCERVALLPGAWGGQRQVSTAELQKPDVLIVGEVAEWETAEYIRDSRSLGKKIALIVLGHSVSEEPGMEYFVDWLKPKLGDVKISHVASGDPFTWM